ncbi:sulfite exporter TauE/SafE family protein [Nitrincola tapanii]|uniref:Probable membrane transporter protein n=1 Tax=Nitrincola tapanii TaxID=1708751 RepID=A0A5A9W617_9GAMM|nr:sulfite exporter TauE/SafE family protein [Nitrincola tapanii]KAA0876217.1 sulfite exporter TauE/SafE family protein [Nitrincola tapanii]
MLMTLALYLILGALAGIVAGLFGIGGGLLIVPVLIFSFELQGLSTAVLTHMAVATSLATIVVTSTSSILAHHKRGAVDWGLFRPMAAGLVLGAVLGVNTAVLLPGPVLQVLLGSFVLLVAVQMLFNLQPKQGAQAPKSAELVAAGGVIGWASSIFGIGGGTLSVPYLNWRNQAMRVAVATSAACGLPIAMMGATTNIWVGWGREGLPEWSLGYVYLPAFLGIVLASSFTAKLGARWAHTLPQAVLKRCFAIFLFLVALRFLGSNLF